LNPRSRPRAGPNQALAERIATGAAELNLRLDSSQVDRFVAYLRLVERWGATYNLTGIRSPEEMVTHHILDCLAAAGALLRRRAASTRHLIDVGSGAGLPGLVFAAVLPDTSVLCVDSVGKKAAFITQAAAVLQTRNAAALHARVEALAGSYDVVASRAFSSLPDFVGATRHLRADNGEWMALKGRVPHEELADLKGIRSTVEPIDVPGLEAERCIVWMQNEPVE
jgi:16S rRNA (guanine527-N7)-methyltransferase